MLAAIGRKLSRLALRQGIWRVAWFLYLLASLWTSADATASFVRLSGSQDPLYCLPQPFEALVVDGFNSFTDKPKLGVNLTFDYMCTQPVQPKFHIIANSSIASQLAGNVAIVALPNCSFRGFSDFFEDMDIRVSLAADLGATGVVAVLGNVGQPPPLTLFSTSIPLCIMDKENGAHLLEAMGPDGSVLLEVDPEGLQLVTGEAISGSEIVSQLRVSGIPLLEPPLPVWPATFNDVESSSKAVEGVIGSVVVAEWSPECIVNFEGTGEFSECQTCWKRASFSTESVFTNAPSFEGNIVLFYSPDSEQEKKLKCFPENYQRSALAQRLGALGVLLSEVTSARRAQFPGPSSTPGVLGLQTFGLLHPHAINVARYSSQPGALVKFPEYRSSSGFEKFFAPRGQGLPALPVQYEIPQENGETRTRTCFAGQAAFNPKSSAAFEKTMAWIKRPTGPCSISDGGGCNLTIQGQEKVNGSVLILFLEDFNFFYAWSQFTSLATDLNASALVIINLDDSVFTLTGSLISSPLPVLNLEHSCGRRMFAAAQRHVFLATGKIPGGISNELNITVSLPPIGNSTPEPTITSTSDEDISGNVAEPISLFSNKILEIRDNLVEVQMRFFLGEPIVRTGSFETVMAGFNPRAHSGTTEKIALAEVAAECLDMYTEGGLNCDSCASKARHLMPAHPWTTFDGQILLIGPKPMLCLDPRVAVDEAVEAGAKAVVFSSSFRNMPQDSGNPTALIPALLLSPADAQVLIENMEGRMTVRLEIPAIEGGRLMSCMAPECDLVPGQISGRGGQPPDTARLSDANQDTSEGNTLAAASIAAIVIASTFGAGVIIAVAVTYCIYRKRTGQLLYSIVSPKRVEKSQS